MHSVHPKQTAVRSWLSLAPDSVLRRECYEGEVAECEERLKSTAKTVMRTLGVNPLGASEHQIEVPLESA